MSKANSLEALVLIFTTFISVLVSRANRIGWFTQEDQQSPPQSKAKTFEVDKEELEGIERPKEEAGHSASVSVPVSIHSSIPR